MKPLQETTDRELLESIYLVNTEQKRMLKSVNIKVTFFFVIVVGYFLIYAAILLYGLLRMS